LGKKLSLLNWNARNERLEWHHSEFQQHSVTRRITLRYCGVLRSAADFVERTAAQHCPKDQLMPMTQAFTLQN